MGALKDLWADYKKKEGEGISRDALRDLETKIHELETQLKFGLYDFDARWARKKQVSTEKVTQSIGTVGNEKVELYRTLCVEAIAEEKIISTLLLELKPELKNNPAKLGQLINHVQTKCIERSRRG